MSGSSPVSRRALFSLAGGSLLAGQMPVSLQSGMSASATSTTMVFDQARQAGPMLHVAGPRDGVLADWARRLLPPMAAVLAPGGRLSLQYGGGSDGVTIANQFDARVAPDGQNALLFPGSVALGWLTGRGLVRLDPGHLLPVLAAVGPGVLMVRGTLAGIKASGRPVLLSPGANHDAALTALLGLDLLGIPARLAAAHDAGANAMFLYGPMAAGQAARLASAGWAPALSTGTGSANGQAHPALHAPHFLSGVSPDRLAGDPLVEAWRAASAASALCAVMVLTRLTPAASIARWRHAARLGMTSAQVIEVAQRQAMILVADNQAAAALSPMRADAATQRALHRWLAARV
jgi:hypothetical protein